MADIYDEEDRKSALIQGLLGAAFPLLGARRGSEFNAFGQAGLLGLNSYNRSLEGATEARDRKAQREQQRLMWEQAQEERALKMQQMQQQREQQAAMQRAAGGAFTGGSPPMGPPTEQGEMQPGVVGQFNPQAYIAALQQHGLPQQAIAAVKEYGPKEKELSRVEHMQFGGKPVSVAFYKDGTREILPYDPKQSEQWQDIPAPRGAAPGLQWQRSSDGQLRSVGSQPPVTNINLGGPKWEGSAGGFVFPPSAENPTGKVVQPTGMPTKEDKPLTAEQAKATAFVNQMQGANQVINELGSTGFTGKSKGQQAAIVAAGAEGMPFIPGTAAIPRAMAGANAQKYQQAELQWTEAALRFMTGANAPEPEIRRNAATYFPRPGDTDAVVEQKAIARANMEQSIRMAAGSTGQRALEKNAQPKAPRAPPVAGEVRDGYRFKGGKPGDRNNWERV